MYRQILILILFFCFVATPALAASYDEDSGRPYLTLSGGISKVFGVDYEDTVGLTNNRSTTDYGFNGMVATGLAYKVGRVELSGGYRYMKLDEVKVNGAPAVAQPGNVDAFDLLLSVFYDFNSTGAISPYFGGGVGGARVAYDTTGFQKKATGFAYQLGTGISLNMGNSFSVDLGYRLLGVTNLDFGAIKSDNILFHNANVGLRFLF